MPHSFVKPFSIALLSAFCLVAQVSAPSPGFVRYDRLPIGRVLGGAGNLVTVATTLGTAEAASFSSSGSLLAANGRIQLLEPDGSVAAQVPYRGATPFLNIGRGLATAIAWLPGSRVILHWDGHDFIAVSAALGPGEGLISSVSLAAPDTARFLVSNPDDTVCATLVSLASGNVISSNILPGVSGPAFQFGSHLLWANREGLQIEHPESGRQTLPLRLTRFTAEQMSEGWVHVFEPGNPAHYALCLTKGEPTLSQIPPASEQMAPLRAQ